MDRQWFYFDNYVYVNNVAPNKVLLYNTLNHDMLTYQNDSIYTFVKELTSIENNNIILYTDGNYKVSSYTLTYLKRPSKIDIHTSPYSEYTNMPTHTHSEIVKLAA